MSNTEDQSNLPSITATQAVSNIIDTVKNLPVLKKEDQRFLVENKEHLATVLHKTHIWRTDTQKLSIISDNYHPTVHSKFHQAILEQKVQFEQTLYLAKDFESKKLEIEELECDLEELGTSKRDDIKRRRIFLDMQFKQFELKQMQIAMEYRIAEVRGWQSIQDQLLNKMRQDGIAEEAIWSKDAGELSSMFLQSLTNLEAISTSTDAAERNNLLAIASFSVKQAMHNNLLDQFRKNCNPAQIAALDFILESFRKDTTTP